MNTNGKIIAYTGIGARETPGPILEMMETIAQFMAKKGFVLRSGGAEGASMAFEKGCDIAGGKKMIFLPWRGFNANNSPIYTIPDRAYDIAKDFEPAWSTLNDSGKRLKARYALTVLGQDLKDPSIGVICYTKEGKMKGGTGQAMKIAMKYKVPIFDLGFYEFQRESIKEKLFAYLAELSIDTDGLEL